MWIRGREKERGQGIIDDETQSQRRGVIDTDVVLTREKILASNKPAKIKLPGMMKR